MTAEATEFLTAGLRPHECHSCGTRVLVKKNSLAHTSIQWTGDAARSCPVFAAHVGAGRHPALLDACDRLTDSIADAVHDGTLAVADSPETTANGHPRPATDSATDVRGKTSNDQPAPAKARPSTESTTLAVPDDAPHEGDSRHATAADRQSASGAAAGSPRTGDTSNRTPIGTAQPADGNPGARAKEQLAHGARTRPANSAAVWDG